MSNTTPPSTAPARRQIPPGPLSGLTADLVGGRILAWTGGVAVIVGVVLFLVMAVSRGWLDVTARTALAGAGSGILLAVGLWLHARRGRTEASVVLVGAATVGLFATLAVGSAVYGVLPPLVAIPAALAVGALATTLAARWAGQPIAWLGLLGALASPALAGAPGRPVVIALLMVAAGCVTATAIWRRWTWLAIAAGVICVPQWGAWAVHDHSPLVVMGVAGWFALVGLAAVLAEPGDRGEATPRAGSVILLVVNAFVAAALGWLSLAAHEHGLAANLWLGALAAAHLLAATAVRVGDAAHPPARLRRTRLRPTASSSMHGLLVLTGVVLTDLAFGLTAHGLVLVAGWAGSAVLLGVLRRSATRRHHHPDLLRVGIAAHIGLALMRTLTEAPPSRLGQGDHPMTAALAVALLAAATLICAQLDAGRTKTLAGALHVLGLAAIAYLPLESLSGPALVGAWALEGLALAGVAARDPGNATVARRGALVFLGLAAAHVSLVEAPPTALIVGAPSLAAAVLGLALVVAAIAGAAVAAPPANTLRRALIVSAGVNALYLASVTIVTVFQPAGALGAIGDFGGSLVDLGVGVRQQGQVLLSACWSVIGLTGVIVGLRRNQPAVRNAALGLLLLAVVKVFLYDLSTLTSIYRVASFVALGLLLLTSAFAYQRLRPPPVPDMRRVHRSQR